MISMRARSRAVRGLGGSSRPSEMKNCSPRCSARIGRSVRHRSDDPIAYWLRSARLVGGLDT